jgi:hypothetical protein
VEGASIKCASQVGTFGAGTRLGTFVIDIKACSSLGETCQGLGQSAGLIEMPGEWHLVSLLSERKQYEVFFLLAATSNTMALHVECESVGLLLLWGSFLGTITKLSGTNFDIFIEKTGKTGSGSTAKQAIIEFGNNSGTVVKVAGLKAKLGTSVERPMSVGSATSLLFTSATIDET